MKKTMTVTVNGQKEEREVLHSQVNPANGMMEDHPMAYPGERVERMLGGEVIIIKGVH